MTFLELIPYLIFLTIIVSIFWGVLKFFYRNKIGLFSLILLLLIFVPFGGMIVSNIWEAQTRSHVGIVLHDMRLVTSAIKSYSNDHNIYPNRVNLKALTTPTSYLGKIPRDRLASALTGEDIELDYILQINEDIPQKSFYAIIALGPDGDSDLEKLSRPFSKEQLVKITYDPSNGTYSNGDIIRIEPITMIEKQ